MNICVIPARGGSKRIHKKNIKNFCGKPIIIWSIEEAIKSNCFEKIIVSTDDEEIIKLVKNYSVDVPFVRPNKLSDDFTEIIPVINHAIKYQIENYKKPTNVCCIFPTAPFILADDIKLGLKKLDNSDADFIFPVTSYSYPIQRSLKIVDNQKIQMFQPEYLNSRSQDLEEFYHDAGLFYWGKVNSWLKNNTIFNNNSLPIILPRYRVCDIDTEEDWKRAEIMFTMIYKDKK